MNVECNQETIDEIKNEIPEEHVIVTPNAENGTHRCALAVDDLPPYERYINVQGDMPDITVDIIHKVNDSLEAAMVATAYTPMDPALRKDPNSVKLIHNGKRAHWFCRASLEYGDHHLGVYGY